MYVCMYACIIIFSSVRPLPRPVLRHQGDSMTSSPGNQCCQKCVSQWFPHAALPTAAGETARAAASQCRDSVIKHVIFSLSFSVTLFFPLQDQ